MLNTLQWLYAPPNRDVIARRTEKGERHELVLPAPPDPERFAAIVFGDTGDSDFLGSGETPQDAVARLLAEEVALPGTSGDARLVLHTGDVVYMTGERRLYDRNFRRPYAPLLVPGSTFERLVFRVPFLPVPGNHDYYDYPRWAGLVARLPVLGRGLRAAARGLFDVSLPQGGSDMGRAYMEAFVARGGEGNGPLRYVPGAATRVPNRYYRFRFGIAEFFAIDSNTLDVLPEGRAPGEGRAAGRRARRLEHEAAQLERELLELDESLERERDRRQREIAGSAPARARALERAAQVAAALSALAVELGQHPAPDGPEAAPAVRDAARRWDGAREELARADSPDAACRALQNLDHAAEAARTALARAEEQLVRMPQGPGHAAADTTRERVEAGLGAWMGDAGGAPSPELEARRRAAAETSLEVQRELARERQRRAPRPGDHDAAQLAWLDRALAESERLRPDGWRIAFLHHPLYTSVRSYCEGAELREIRANLLPLLAGRVHAVFSGHAHAFEWLRSSHLPHAGLFVTGGGGQITLGKSVLDPRRLERHHHQVEALREAGVTGVAHAGRGPAASDGESGSLWHYLRLEVAPDVLRIVPIGVRRTAAGFRRERPMPAYLADVAHAAGAWQARRLVAVEVRRDRPPTAVWEEGGGG